MSMSGLIGIGCNLCQISSIVPFVVPLRCISV